MKERKKERISYEPRCTHEKNPLLKKQRIVTHMPILPIYKSGVSKIARTIGIST